MPPQSTLNNSDDMPRWDDNIGTIEADSPQSVGLIDSALIDFFTRHSPNHPLLSAILELRQQRLLGHDYLALTLDEHDIHTLIHKIPTSQSLVAVVESTASQAVFQDLASLCGRANSTMPLLPPFILEKPRAHPHIKNNGLVYHLYFTRDYLAELRIVRALKMINQSGTAIENASLKHNTPISPFSPLHHPNWQWTNEQTLAINTALNAPLTILTGGPGSGKSTVMCALAQSYLAQGIKAKRLIIAAPTGKAVERLIELFQAQGSASPLAALIPQVQTVHRLLGLTWSGVPRYNADNPLPYEVVMVDECSMIDVNLFAHLLSAVAGDGPGTVEHMPTGHVKQTRTGQTTRHLVLMGDPFQLSAVEHGAVFRQLALAPILENLPQKPSTTLWPHIQLIGNQRARHQALGHCAMAIRHNRFDDLQTLPETPDAPVSWQRLHIKTNAAYAAFEKFERFERLDKKSLEHFKTAVLNFYEAYIKALEELVHAESIEANPMKALIKLYSTLRQSRILSAKNVGEIGTRQINGWLSQHINQRLAKIKGPRALSRLPFHSSDKWQDGHALLLQKNLAHYGLTNGSTGLIWQGRCWFPNTSTVNEEALSKPHDISLCAYPLSLSQLCSGGFAISIHKAQGSEFESVMLVIPPTMPALIAKPASVPLSRELLYTGCTRARQTLSLWACEDDIKAALSQTEERRCAILERWS